jgi:hypothetical protein
MGADHPTATGGDEELALKEDSFNASMKWSVKTNWQCGQQAKNSAQPYCSQAHKMTFVLK